MTPHDPFPPEDLDALLTPAPTPPSDVLQQAILRQTTGVVRRRRHLRRLVQATALLFCYVAGAASMRSWEQVSAVQSVARIEQPAVPTTDADTVLKHDQTVVIKPPAPQTAKPPLSRYERLRRFSDRLLEEKGDIPRAARNYALALKHATPEERAISSDDSWLLMAVKQDRLQEKSDVHPGS